jgi:alkyl sulfatase BDS1-like metallo-beta-lactamase superfamily hydrolase
MPRAVFVDLMEGRARFAERLAAGDIRASGEAAALERLVGMLDQFRPDFPMVSPLENGR